MDHAVVVVHGDCYMALANSLRCAVEMGRDCGLVRAAAAAALHPVVLRVFADPAGRGRVLGWEHRDQRSFSAREGSRRTRAASGLVRRRGLLWLEQRCYNGL